MHPALCLLALIWDDDEDLDKGYYFNGWRFYSIREIFYPRLPLSSYLRFVWRMILSTWIETKIQDLRSKRNDRDVLIPFKG